MVGLKLCFEKLRTQSRKSTTENTGKYQYVSVSFNCYIKVIQALKCSRCTLVFLQNMFAHVYIFVTCPLQIHGVLVSRPVQLLVPIWSREGTNNALATCSSQLIHPGKALSKHPGKALSKHPGKALSKHPGKAL